MRKPQVKNSDDLHRSHHGGALSLRLGLEAGAEGWERRTLPPLPARGVWEAPAPAFPALPTVMMTWQSGSLLTFRCF